MRSQFYVSTTCIAITWEHPEIGPVLNRVADYYGVQHRDSADAEPDLHLEIRCLDQLKYPGQASRIYAYRNGITGWREDSGIYFRTDFCQAFISLPHASAILTLHPDLLDDPSALRSDLFNTFVLSLLLLLRGKQLFSLHSAALELDGQGVLLVASSDSGKSTLSYSLVRNGWSFVSDDAILLRAAADGVQALPFRRNFGLDEVARQYFPEIDGGLGGRFTSQEKWAIRMHDLYPARALEYCVPRLLILPEIADRDHSIITPVTQREAFCRLLDQSPFFGLEPSFTGLHLGLLKTLISQSRAFRLSAGRDILADSTVATSLLEPLLTAGIPA